MSNSVNEVINRQDFLINLSKEYSGIMLGIEALSLDFEFIRRIPLGTSKIQVMQSEVRHRLDSTKFQFEQFIKLLNDLYVRSNNIDYIVRNNPLPLIMERYQREVSFLIENIIFNIISLFDYFTLLINYIIAKTDHEYDWNKLQSFARNNTGLFLKANTEEIKNIILSIHNSLIDKMYNYRSQLIHRKSDVVGCKGSSDYSNDKISITFFCTPKQLKTFGIDNKTDLNYPINLLIETIYDQAVDSVIKIIRGLRKYQDSLDIDESKPILTVFNYDDEQKPISVGQSYWALFDGIFKSTNRW